MRASRQRFHVRSRCAPLLIASLSVVLGGCVHPRREGAEPPLPHVKLHFDPPEAIALEYTAVSGARHTVNVDNVVEAGGRIEAVRDDTLTIVASYIMEAPAAAGAKTERTPVHEPFTVARLTIVVGPAVRVEPWTTSVERANRIFRSVLMIVVVAPLLLFVFDLAHNVR